jgi:cysteine desulfurase
MGRLAALRARLEDEIKAAGGVVVAEAAARIATIGAYAMPGVASESQLVQFDLAGIAVSAGSACSSGAMKASHVLAAMETPAEVASSFLRISFGSSTSNSDIDRFLGEWRRMVDRAKAA